jgi:hypothetical protein
LSASGAAILDLLRTLDPRLRALAIMPLGLVAFLAYLFVLLGDPLAYFHVQTIGWVHGLRNPVENIWASLHDGLANRYNTVAFLIGSILLLVGVRLARIPAMLAVFAWLVAFMTMSSEPSGSARYILALFPLYLLVPALPRSKRLVLITGLAAGLAIFIYFWMKPAQILL